MLKGRGLSASLKALRTNNSNSQNNNDNNNDKLARAQSLSNVGGEKERSNAHASPPSPESSKDPHYLLQDEDLEGLMNLGEERGFEEVLSQRNRRGVPFIHALVEGNHVMILNCLLVNLAQKDGSILQLRDQNGWTPVHVACDRGNVAMIRLFLAIPGFEANAETRDLTTPLHHIIKHVPSPHYRASLGLSASQAHAAINAADNTRDSMALKPEAINLMSSSSGGGFNRKSMMVTIERNVNFTRMSRLCEELIERGADVNHANFRGETLLHKAVAVCSSEVVRWIISSHKWRINIHAVNKLGETALHIAARGKKDTVKVLLQAGANPNTAGKYGTALDIAREADEPDIVALLDGTTDITPDPSEWSLVEPRGRRQPRGSEEIAFEEFEALKKQIQSKGLKEVVNTMDATGCTLIHTLCAKGKSQVLLYLLLNYNDIDLRAQTRSGGFTPLHLAASATLRGQLKIVDLLLHSRLANPVSKDNEGSTPFHIFIDYFYEGQNMSELGIYLLTAKSFLIERKLTSEQILNFENVAGETPLHVASAVGKIHAVKFLLEQGANVNALTKAGDSSLILATQNKHVAVVKLLLEHGANVEVSSRSGSAIQIARAAREVELIEVIGNAFNSDELAASLKRERKEKKKAEEKSKKEEKKKAKEMKKAKKKNREEVDSKRQGFRDIDGSKIASLQSTIKKTVPEPIVHAKKGNWEGIEVLIKEKGLQHVMRDTDSRGQTLLHHLVEQKNMALIKKVLELYKDRLEPDLNVQDNEGWSVLHLAASSGSVDVLLQLLSCKRFDASLISREGSTPIHYLMRKFPNTANRKLSDGPLQKELESAVSSFDIDDVKTRPRDYTECIPPEVLPWCEAIGMLIYAGCNVRATNQNGETVLHSASMAGSTPAISWLHDNESWSIDKNARTKHGETCLHFAARSGKIDAVRMLLEIGVDDTISGVCGTARDIAEEGEHLEIARILKDYRQSEEEEIARERSGTATGRKRKGTLNVALLCDEIDDIFDNATKNSRSPSERSLGMTP